MSDVLRISAASAAVSLLTGFLSGTAQAADDTLSAVVVTATRVAQPIDQVIGSVTVITREQIDARQATSLQDLLRGEAGLDISNNGGPGKASAIFLRGANAAQTLILIDGVRMGSATAGTTSIEYLPVDQIERIEIVRGPRSSLYGADAVGGVIQIFTRRNQGVNASMATGNFNTQQFSAGFGLQQQALRFSVQGSYQQTDGIDSSTRGLEPDRDGYRNSNASTRIGYDFSQHVDLELSTLYSQGFTKYDGSFVNETHFINSAPSARLRVRANDSLTLSLQGGITSDRNDNLLNNTLSSRFNTEKRSGSLQGDWQITPATLVSLGYDYLNDEVTSSTNYAVSQRDNQAIYLQALNQWGAHAFNASIRGDDNEQFGTHTTGNLGWKWSVLGPALSINLGVGSAFHTPSFNDLYFPFGYGNPNLKPERSRSYEGGLGGSWQVLQWQAQVYQTEVRDLIVLDSNFFPQNMSKTRLRGAELGATLHWQQVTGSVTYSAQSPVNRQAGGNFNHLLPRRSRQSGRVELGYDFGKAQVSGVVYAVGRRYDDLANTIRLPGYATVDLKADVQLIEHLGIQVKVGNFLDRGYQTANNYRQEGRTLLLTLRYLP